MAEHDVHREIREAAIQVGELIAMHQEFHVPAHRRDALRHCGEFGHRQRAGLAVFHIDYIYAHAAHTGCIEFREFRIGNVAFNHCDAAKRAACRAHGC